MASWLILDWDHEQFRILSAQGTRRGITINATATFAHPEPLTPSTAERVGKALRNFLKAQKIAAAPVIVGLGRDRIFLKELRIPAIAAHEEASLVRFQTGKEMTEAVDNYAVDYSYLSNGAADRHIMTVAARRDIVVTCQALCAAAGLRLHAVTPRLFGTASALNHAVAPEPSPLQPNRLNAILSVNQRWAELCFFRGKRLLQAQALANGPLLAGEVRRNLAVFSAQHAVDVDLEGPDKLYVFADDPAVVKELHLGQPLPVAELDPLADAPGENRAAFAGAVGLAELWSEAGERPVNLASPKRSSAPTTATQQRALIYGAVAALAAILLIGGMIYANVSRRKKVDELAAYQESKKGELNFTAQDRVDLEFYKDWEDSSVPWLDEMYDLTARYPFETGFRVNQFAGTSIGTKKNLKDKYVANLKVSGITPSGKEREPVYDLIGAMSRDAHLRTSTKGGKPGVDYALSIDIARQELKLYDTLLAVPPRLKAVAPPSAAPPDPPPGPELTLTDDERKNAEPIPAPLEKKDDEKGGDQ